MGGGRCFGTIRIPGSEPQGSWYGESAEIIRNYTYPECSSYRIVWLVWKSPVCHRILRQTSPLFSITITLRIRLPSFRSSRSLHKQPRILQISVRTHPVYAIVQFPWKRTGSDYRVRSSVPEQGKTGGYHSPRSVSRLIPDRLRDPFSCDPFFFSCRDLQRSGGCSRHWKGTLSVKEPRLSRFIKRSENTDGSVPFVGVKLFSPLWITAVWLFRKGHCSMIKLCGSGNPCHCGVKV